MSNRTPLSTYEDWGEFGTRHYGMVDVYEATDSCLTVIHNKTTSTGWKPANMGVIADYCVEVFRNLGLSDQRIDEQVVRLTFFRGNDQDKFNEEAGTEGFDWCGVCNSQQLGTMTYEHHIMLATNGAHLMAYDEMDMEAIIRTLTHELVHAAQAATDSLHYTWFPVRGECKVRFMDGDGIQKAWDGELDYYDQAWEWEAYAKQTTTMLAVFATTDIRIRNLVVEDIGPEDREAELTRRWIAFLHDGRGENCDLRRRSVA